MAEARRPGQPASPPLRAPPAARPNGPQERLLVGTVVCDIDIGRRHPERPFLGRNRPALTAVASHRP